MSEAISSFEVNARIRIWLKIRPHVQNNNFFPKQFSSSSFGHLVNNGFLEKTTSQKTQQSHIYGQYADNSLTHSLT
jgi:hypothetical protein